MTYLGIDGGGSKTVALLAGDRLNCLARVETGPSNWLSVGEDDARRAITEAVSRLEIHPDIVCGGFAGASRPEGRAFFAGILQSLLPRARVWIESDAFVAYIGALGIQPGVLLVAGTGSIAIGRHADGTMIRAGGWGPQFGDEGSGFWIGREAVRAALRSVDAGKDRGFVERTARSLGLSSIQDVAAAWNSGRVGVPAIAALFPEVVDWYPEEPAQRILTSAAQHLRTITERVSKRLGIPVCAMSVSGSVATHPLMRQLVGLEFQDPQHPPEWGAVFWARQQAG